MLEPPIQLPRHLVNQILHLAQLSPHQRIAGLVGAIDGKPHTCEPVNTTEDGGRMDPQDRDNALDALQARAETLFAVLHSHPATPAAPSPDDLLNSDFPEALRLIISLGTKGVLELRGFRINAQRVVREIELRLTE